VSVGDLRYDPLTGRARRGKRAFTLSNIERRLMGCLVAGTGPVSIIELRQAGWNDAPAAADTALTRQAEHAVEVAMWRLGGKINGPGEQRLLTSRSVNARRVGYRLDAPTVAATHTSADRDDDATSVSIR
jgi:DNA-binding response OmpR family regulator